MGDLCVNVLMFISSLECTGFSSCGADLNLPCSMWNLPGPGFKLMFPALEGRFLTTGPAGKSSQAVVKWKKLYLCTWDWFESPY